ncbi:type II secretion system protein [Nonlabens xiamenensis]|uniref:type II secretion system protein n=1 Tax=Nonlabens xiamenensis TaxID=2341043 RepID=UPI000F6123FC|nr:type II secretion system protein [Nonlabens xiamenensis]
MRNPTQPNHLSAFNLQEMLVTLCIVGIATMILLPNLMPFISSTKALEAQLQLRSLYTLQTQYRYINSKYAQDLKDLDFDQPLTEKEGGIAKYDYRVLEVTPSSFVIEAEAVVDFDGDGTLNLWRIDETGVFKEVVKD